VKNLKVKEVMKMTLKHIEVEGCIVNIRTGLTDRKGRRVTSVEILPDDHYSGEPIWKLIGCINNRVVQLKSQKAH
jgi:hypothetical protein